MKKTFTLLFFVGATITSIAQDKVDKDHTNYYQVPETMTNDAYTFSCKNIVSRYDFCKFGYELSNTTNDYLIFKIEESVLSVGGRDVPQKDKEHFIKPNGSKSGTFVADGDENFNFHHETFDFKLDGIYRLPAEGEVQNGEDFNLPASTNEITVGDFTVKLKKLKQETKLTKATFSVTYKGDDYGIVDGSKISVSVPAKGDKKFANESKEKGQVLKKGDEVSIDVEVRIPAKYADMQFADLHVIWNNTFQVSKAEKLEGGSLSFSVDKALTEEKN